MTFPYIIAEAGVNHNGSLEMALRMVDEAAAMGADAIKFQTFRAEDIVTLNAPKADYQVQNDRSSVSQYDMLRRLELNDAAHRALLDHCNQVGIDFLSTPFSLPAARFLNSLGMKVWKIPSGEITNLPLLEYIGSVADSIILSTGMATLDEVRHAVAVLNESGTPKSHIRLLHCTTAYPTPPGDVNLAAMNTLRSLGCAGVGYSDHTEGIVIPVAAVAMGATIIEKHFTLDKSLPGPDHKASLTPSDFRHMVDNIRIAYEAIGSETKTPAVSEKGNAAVARKSIVAAREILPGEIFDSSNLTTKRPATGLSPMVWYRLIGQRASQHYLKDEQISKAELK